jgi:hypothetical protein
MAKDKGILFMRYIKKWLNHLSVSRGLQQAANGQLVEVDLSKYDVTEDGKE